MSLVPDKPVGEYVIGAVSVIVPGKVEVCRLTLVEADIDELACLATKPAGPPWISSMASQSTAPAADKVPITRTRLTLLPSQNRCFLRAIRNAREYD
jgi:hypothetical protein